MRLAAAILLVHGAGCATTGKPTLLTPDLAGGGEVGSLLARSPLPPGQNVGITEVARGSSSSLHLVQIRDREAPHVHTRYDISVVLVRGHGSLFLAGRILPMRTGDAAFVPRGTTHYFVNHADEPAVALVTFAPAFSGPDQESRPVP